MRLCNYDYVIKEGDLYKGELRSNLYNKLAYKKSFVMLCIIIYNFLLPCSESRTALAVRMDGSIVKHWMSIHVHIYEHSTFYVSWYLSFY